MKKIGNYTCGAVLAMALAFVFTAMSLTVMSLASCDNGSTSVGDVTISKVEFDAEPGEPPYILSVGQIRTVTAKVTPANATDKKFTVTSADTSIATVTSTVNGANVEVSVTGKAVGSTTITITHNATGMFISADVQVKAVGPDEDGSPEHPWLVYDETTLRKVGKETEAGGWTLSAHYQQTANIDLTGKANWTRIGSGSGINAFSGGYDGGNYSITRLTITTNALTNEQGLFGYVIGGTVKNVKLVDCNIATTVDNVGGIAGYMDIKALIENCSVSGNVSGKSNVGGIIGHSNSTISNYKVNSSTVKNCYTSCDVSGSDVNVGGIAGASNYGTIEYSCSTGTVSGVGNVGGLAGNMYTTYNVLSNDGIRVEYCYATGNVNGAGSYVGGLVGVLGVGIFTNSYATGNVTAGGNGVGGLVGVTATTYSSSNNCYATGTVTGNNYVGGMFGGGGSGTIVNCLALNSTLTGSAVRINGDSRYTINNYARKDMLLNGTPVISTNPVSNQGADLPVDDSLPLADIFGPDIVNWDSAIWVIPAGNLVVGCPLPTLKNMPGPEQNPTLPEIPEP